MSEVFGNKNAAYNDYVKPFGNVKYKNSVV